MSSASQPGIFTGNRGLCAYPGDASDNAASRWNRQIVGTEVPRRPSVDKGMNIYRLFSFRSTLDATKPPVNPEFNRILLSSWSQKFFWMQSFCLQQQTNWTLPKLLYPQPKERRTDFFREHLGVSTIICRLFTTSTFGRVPAAAREPEQWEQLQRPDWWRSSCAQLGENSANTEVVGWARFARCSSIESGCISPVRLMKLGGALEKHSVWKFPNPGNLGAMYPSAT